MKSTAADVVHLATAELRLAKAELTEGVRAQAGRVALLAAALVPLGVAYLLGVAALVVWVRPLFGMAGALAAVALSQAALGGVIVAVASPRLGAKSWREGGREVAKEGGETETLGSGRTGRTGVRGA